MKLVSGIPVYFIWVKYISWLFYANEAMMITLWRNVDKISCPETSANLNASSMLLAAANLNLTAVLNLTSNSTTSASDLLNLEAASSHNVKRCLVTGYDVLKYRSMDEVSSAVETSKTSQKLAINKPEQLHLLSFQANFSFDMGMLVLMCCFWPTIAGIGLYIKAKR